MNPVCPSCHTEIVWDPEIGPEELCPHCYNPMEEYSTVQLKVNNQTEANVRQQHPFNDNEEDLDEEQDDLSALDDWEDTEDLQGYEDAVTLYLDNQEEAIQCERCHDYMILAGHQQITSPQFVPNVPRSVGRALLNTPFRLKMFVCPACFQVSYQVAEEDRLAAVQQFLE